MSLNPKVDRIPRPSVSRAVKLRLATPDDLEILQFWDRQPHVIAAKGQRRLAVAERARPQPRLARAADRRSRRPPDRLRPDHRPSREESQYWGCIDEGYRAIDIWIGEQDAPRPRLRHADDEAGHRSAAFADPSVKPILVDPRERQHPRSSLLRAPGIRICRGPLLRRGPLHRLSPDAVPRTPPGTPNTA